ncbi:MAG TPA: hypothetical protein VNU68_30900 [Verrucomicrobiae bacterium]|nr:hypothetical protein [Verrucomicrobiae bacterium]
MSYKYEEIKPRIFTEEGQRIFLSIRDKANQLLKVAGAVRMQELIQGHSGSNWDMIACVDRLVELGEIREITVAGRVAGQHRVFVSLRE